MKRFSIIAVSSLVFGSIGPSLGAVVVAMTTRHGDFAHHLFPLSYAFGIVPALVAGAIYGVLRLRIGTETLSWRRRAGLGAFSGFIGCLVFVTLGATYTLVTAGTATFRSELDFYGLEFLAGIPAGVICAVVLGPWLRTTAIEAPHSPPSIPG
jgi:hypothetical protein